MLILTDGEIEIVTVFTFGDDGPVCLVKGNTNESIVQWKFKDNSFTLLREYINPQDMSGHSYSFWL